MPCRLLPGEDTCSYIPDFQWQVLKRVLLQVYDDVMQGFGPGLELQCLMGGSPLSKRKGKGRWTSMHCTMLTQALRICGLHQFC